MAADVPFLGNTITLISKSDVRYQGVLVGIDPKEATVSLQNVRCFGTEDRRPKDQAIPATHEIYDFIIFRGSDIKDLQVQEQAPPTVSDPAIISIQKKTPAAPASSSVFASSLSTDDEVDAQNSKHLQQQQRGGQQNNNRRQQGQSNAKPQHSTGRFSRDSSDSQSQQQSKRPQHQQQQQQPKQHASWRAAAASSSESKSSEDAPQSSEKDADGNWSGPGSSNYLNHHRGGNRKGGSAFAGDVPKNDFDFETSNAKFGAMMQQFHTVSVSDDANAASSSSSSDSAALSSSSSSSSSAATPSQPFPAVEKKYDKKSSFFDDLSSGQQNMSRQQSRQVDVETFGSSAQNFRGGRGGHRGGRGGHRGGFRHRNNE